jgi:fermentation-respiration switch protein FrsA (DUF1100 family)
MGSGPACALASTKPIKGLILFSAYKSVKLAAKALVGDFLGIFVKERFENIKAIENMSCPTYLIHGKADNVIPCYHSIDLFNKSNAEYKKLHTPEDMTHNDFRMEDDLIVPVLEFLEDNHFNFINQDKLINSQAFAALKI